MKRVLVESWADLERPELDALPTRFYNDRAPSVEREEKNSVEEERKKKSLLGGGTVVSLIQRLRKKVFIALAVNIDDNNNCISGFYVIE